MADDKNGQSDEAGHVKDLKQRPLEAVDFAVAADGGDETLGRENIVNGRDHASCGDEGRHAVAARRFFDSVFYRSQSWFH